MYSAGVMTPSSSAGVSLIWDRQRLQGVRSIVDDLLSFMGIAALQSG